MKNYDATVALMDLYGGSNTTYQGGVQSGNFYNPNNASLTFGVKTNDFYMFESCELPANITLPLWDFTVSTGAAGEYYIPLTSINEELVRTTFHGPVEFGTAYCMVSSDEIGSDELLVPCAIEKILTFNGDKEFKVKASGFTRNEKKIVYEEEAAEVVGDTFTATMNNGMSRLSSIQIVATPPFNIKVYMRLIYMLPYTDDGKNNLIISTTSNDLKVGYTFNNSDVLDNLLEYVPASTSQDQITENSGQIRPQIIVNADLYNPSSIDISRIYALQSLNNNIISETESNFLNSNNIDSIYGWEPYSEGWEDWKG